MCDKNDGCCCGRDNGNEGACGCGGTTNGTLTAAMEVAGVESIPGAEVHPASLNVSYDD